MTKSTKETTIGTTIAMVVTVELFLFLQKEETGNYKILDDENIIIHNYKRSN